jgi:hypothetical protein
VLMSTNALESTDGYRSSYAGKSEEERGFHRGGMCCVKCDGHWLVTVDHCFKELLEGDREENLAGLRIGGEFHPNHLAIGRAYILYIPSEAQSWLKPQRYPSNCRLWSLGRINIVRNGHWQPYFGAWW